MLQVDADHTEIISATRYVPTDVGVAAAVVDDGVLQVFCTVAGPHARGHRLDQLHRAAAEPVRAAA